MKTGTAQVVFYGTISSILAGAVLGDHCSPISDTTVLSSVATKCDLMNHVKTQLPYAVLAGAVGVLVGDLPTGFEVYPEYVGILLGVATVLTTCWLLAVKVDDLDRVDRVSLPATAVAVVAIDVLMYLLLCRSPSS